MSQPVELSIVTTVYKSEKYLPEFIALILQSIKEIGINNFELLFVLDGITDASKEYLLARKKDIPQIVVVELSRNFGHHYAASAGLNTASGDLVFLIDCDLEVSPTVLTAFFHELKKQSCDVVYGVQKMRKGGFTERFFGGLFWKMINALSDTKIPHNIVTERLMTRNYIDALNSMGDKNLFMAGLMYWAGFNQVGVPVDKKQRTGQSSYSFGKRISLVFEAVTSFSERPLKILFKIGLYITALSVIASVYLLIKKILYPNTIFMGYTSVFTLILFSLGMLISSIGIVGIYLSRIFKQVQNRPLFIIKKIY
ncbi:MAG TPA: glycosyltransferase family 2 protein [Bacteroidia bacterium]|nr:glycosyltransferase family 2 protein [Bacteroidia bacterium]